MADEPRRSGRATKGQHTKNVDEPERVDTPPAKAKGKGKRSKNAPVEEEEESAEEIIRCLCGGENDDWTFICCDNCNSWQHNACMGLPDKYKEKNYFCQECRPEDHADIVAALNAGEKASTIALRNRKGPKTAHQKRGRKSQGGRQSVGGEAGHAEAPDVAKSTPSEQNKRKQSSEDTAQPSKFRKGSNHAVDASTSKQSKSKNGAQSSLDSLKLADSLEDLHNPIRKKTASGIKFKMVPLIKNSSASGSFRIPDGDTADSLAERLAVKLEYSLFMNHCGKSTEISDAYKRQTQTIIANVPNNPVLALDFFNGSITPDVLSTMSARDMATDEQKKRDAKMREENEKQAILVQEEGTRIRRTHKGEELVEDSGAQFASESITSNAPPRRMLSHDEGDAEPAGNDPASAGQSRGRPPPISTDNGGKRASMDNTSPPEARRSSSNFNIQNVWSNIQSPTGGHARPMQQPARRGSGAGAISPQAADEDIDRLLGDDEADDAPYSPVETSMDPSLVWRGAVDMPIPHSPSIARFNSRAYHVAGANLGGRENSGAIFPHDIVLAGRISAEAADQYLSSLSAARATDVSVFELIPASNEASERAQFDTLFQYLHSRSRFGVVSEKSHRNNVRDVYLVPLDEGAGPIPQFIQRLDHNIIESPRPRRMLVIVFVIRWKSPVPSAQPTPATPSAPVASATTPIAPEQSSISTGTAQPIRTTASPMAGSVGGNNAHQLPPYHISASQPPQGYQQPYPSSLPPNPYGPSTSQMPPSGHQAAQPYPSIPPYSQHHSGQQVAKQILGQYFDAPVPQQLLKPTEFNVATDLLQNMRRIFDKHPQALTDFGEFQRILSSGT